MFAEWLKLIRQTTEAILAAQRVIALRLMHLAAGGPGSQREGRRMVVEKFAAAAQAGVIAARGGDLHAIVRHYSRAVKANDKRLRRRKS